MNILTFFRLQLSESDGTPSNNRVLLALMVVILLALLIVSSAHNGWKLPEVPPSLETCLEWLGGILAGASTLGKFAGKANA
jgi:hypothetical protein